LLLGVSSRDVDKRGVPLFHLFSDCFAHATGYQRETFGILWRLLPAIVFSRAQYLIILLLLSVLRSSKGAFSEREHEPEVEDTSRGNRLLRRRGGAKDTNLLSMGGVQSASVPAPSTGGSVGSYSF
jgi:hypothetical protein